MNPLIKAQIIQGINQISGSFQAKPDFMYYDHKTKKQLDNVGPVLSKFGLQRELGEAERHRLVKASKSRTRLFEPKSVKNDKSVFEPIVEIEDTAPLHQRDCKGPGQYTVIDFRSWSDEWRVRTRVDTPMKQPTPPDGKRSTTMLTDAGARKLADSCNYMALHKGGYKTFITGTFNDERRAAIAAGETTIQREVTRSMDAMKKMYLRGWNTSNSEQVKPAGEEFCYSWVVEIPKNDAGEENPHVHILMNWRVQYCHFEEWSQRIERIWGNGYFHLEKIKDPLCAGAYMAKAAGYITKANGESDQGTVKGNRYSISKPARAPGWCCFGEYELGVMGKLIADIYDHMTHKHGEKFAQRKQLNDQLQQAPKKSRTRHAIGKKLEKIRKTLNDLPIRASKYQLIIKGGEQLSKFTDWAEQQGWNPNYRPSSIWRAEFNKQMNWRKEQRKLRSFRWCDHNFMSLIKESGQYLIGGEPDHIPWGEYESI